MGVKISKRYSYKLQPKVLKLGLNFPPNCPHKMTFGIFDFPIFNELFSKISNSPFVAYGEIKNLNYLENERS